MAKRPVFDALDFAQAASATCNPLRGPTPPTQVVLWLVALLAAGLIAKDLGLLPRMLGGR